MNEVLTVALRVATPLALLAVVAALAFYAYWRRLRREEKQLALLPAKERAASVDEFLTRYRLDAANLTRDQRFQLIQRELETRHRRAVLGMAIAGVAVMVCFVAATAAYMLRADRPNPSPNAGANDEKPKRAVLNVILEPMELDKRTGLRLGSESFQHSVPEQVVRDAANWVQATLDKSYPQAEEQLLVRAEIATGSSGPPKLVVVPTHLEKHAFFWVFGEGVKQGHFPLSKAREEIVAVIEMALTKSGANRPTMLLHIDRPGYDLALMRLSSGNPAKESMKKDEPPFTVIVDVRGNDVVAEALRGELGKLGIAALAKSSLPEKITEYGNSMKPQLSDATRLAHLRRARINAFVSATYELKSP